MHPRRAGFFLLLVLLLLPGGALAGQSEAESNALTTLDGVFTPQQVEAGEELFRKVCFGCHDTFEFVESGYMTSWVGQPLWGLYEYVVTSMPDDNPGSLRDREYAAVFAYLLSLNGLPVGEVRLEGDEERLRRMIVRLPEVSGGASSSGEGGAR